MARQLFLPSTVLFSDFLMLQRLIIPETNVKIHFKWSTPQCPCCPCHPPPRVSLQLALPRGGTSVFWCCSRVRPWGITGNNLYLEQEGLRSGFTSWKEGRCHPLQSVTGSGTGGGTRGWDGLWGPGALLSPPELLLGTAQRRDRAGECPWHREGARAPQLGSGPCPLEPLSAAELLLLCARTSRAGTERPRLGWGPG